MNGFSRSRYFNGLPPDELWGVQTKDPKATRTRGESARARRRAKKVARGRGLPLKVFLGKRPC